MGKTLARTRLTPAERAELPELLAEVVSIQRPRTRGECVDGPRPCPWVSCKHHLMLDINYGTRTVKLNFREWEEMPESCVLDVADRGRTQLHIVGEYIGLTRERIRQIEMQALARLKDLVDDELKDALER